MQKPPQKSSFAKRPRIHRFWLVMGAVVFFVASLSYALFGTGTQQSPSAQKATQVPRQSSPTPFLELRFAALDPFAQDALLNERPSGNRPGIAVAGMPPVGVYLPQVSSPTPSPAPTATASLSPSPSQTPTATSSATETLIPSPTLSTTPSQTPSATPSLTLSPTEEPPTVTRIPLSETPTRTLSPTPITPTLTPTQTHTATDTLTATPSPSQTPSLTPTQTASATPTPSPTPTYTPTPSFTPLPSLTRTATANADERATRLIPTIVAYDESLAVFNCPPGIMPVEGVLTQRFHSWHQAIDIGVHVGTPVVATHTGVITYADWNVIGYGYLVVVTSGDYITYYAHLSGFEVELGDIVRQGEIIAYSGNTGNSSGPHLHYETRINNIPVDPLTFNDRGLGTC